MTRPCSAVYNSFLDSDHLRKILPQIEHTTLHRSRYNIQFTGSLRYGKRLCHGVDSQICGFKNAERYFDMLYGSGTCIPQIIEDPICRKYMQFYDCPFFNIILFKL
jgi:hypothetical protein